MYKKHKVIIGIIMAFLIFISIPINNNVDAGAFAELFGIKDDTGGFIVDNSYDYFFIGKLSDYGTKVGDYFIKVSKGANIMKYKPERAIELAGKGGFLLKLSNGLRFGGQALNLYNTGVDTYKLFTEDSKHDTTIEKGIDKALLAADVSMGWYAVGAGAIALLTAPAWGAGFVAAAGATGATFIAGKIGVGVTRIMFNSQTYRDASAFIRGKKKIVFAPFHRPGMKEGLDIIKEEFGFDLYPGMQREIPDPSTGIPVYKPNIYLYSDVDMNVNVHIYPSDWITISDPIYNDKSGWNANIINGSLNGTEDYLFYEAIVPDENFQKETGWVVNANNRMNDIVRILDDYKFNEQEKKDFIDYWVNKLDVDKDYIFYPQETEIVDLIMPLVTSIKADEEYRIWFYMEEKENQVVTKPKNIEVISRNGFTIVEWGGILLD